MPESFDPDKSIIGDIETFLKLPLEDKTPGWLAKCKHLKVYLDAENKSVECQECKKVLDPFWYLQLLAKEWSFRRYQDSEAVTAWRELENQRKQAQARGNHYVRPLKGDGQGCWDAYEALHGEPPEYVYYSGAWYAGKKGGAELFDYILQQLAWKAKESQ